MTGKNAYQLAEERQTWPAHLRRRLARELRSGPPRARHYGCSSAPRAVAQALREVGPIGDRWEAARALRIWGLCWAAVAEVVGYANVAIAREAVARAGGIPPSETIGGRLHACARADMDRAETIEDQIAAGRTWGLSMSAIARAIGLSTSHTWRRASCRE